MRKLFGKSKKAEGRRVSLCLQRPISSIAWIERQEEGNQPKIHLASELQHSSSQDLQEVLSQVVQRNHLQNSTCINVLPPDSYQLTQLDLAELPAEELLEAARWQLGERIDYPASEAVLDLFEIASFGGEKKPLTYVVSARESILCEKVELVKKADLSLAAIDVPEFALRNICNLYSGDHRGLAVLLLLEKNGMLVIVRDTILYLFRMFHIGMNDLLPHADGQLEALTEQIDAIVLEVQRSFDFCESAFQLPMVSRLLVAQTVKDIPPLISYLNEYLATSVERLDFNGVLEIPEGSSQIELNRHLLAIGGALREEEG